MFILICISFQIWSFLLGLRGGKLSSYGKMCEQRDTSLNLLTKYRVEWCSTYLVLLSVEVMLKDIFSSIFNLICVLTLTGPCLFLRTRRPVKKNLRFFCPLKKKNWVIFFNDPWGSQDIFRKSHEVWGHSKVVKPK